MHTRYLVTFSKEIADDSKKARDYVYEYLLDNGFVYQDTRWSSGLADWFVIGGGCSGEFTFSTDWGKEFEKKVDKFLKEKYPALDRGIQGVRYGSDEKKKLREKAISEVEKMWEKVLPEGYPKVPYIRDYHQHEGYDDDAQIVTQELYDNHLKEYEGEYEGDYHADLEYEEVSPDFIGKKWVVLVDYHS